MLKISTLALAGLLFGTALALVGLLFGSAVAWAHPSFTPSCTILDRNKLAVPLTLALDNPSCTSSKPCLEAVDLNANPLGLAGETTFTCRADNLGTGPFTILSFSNTNDTCDLGPETAPIVKTQVWQEVINNVGEAVLTCIFPVPTVTPH